MTRPKALEYVRDRADHLRDRVQQSPEVQRIQRKVTSRLSNWMDKAIEEDYYTRLRRLLIVTGVISSILGLVVLSSVDLTNNLRLFMSLFTFLSATMALSSHFEHKMSVLASGTLCALLGLSALTINLLFSSLLIIVAASAQLFQFSLIQYSDKNFEQRIIEQNHSQMSVDFPRY